MTTFFFYIALLYNQLTPKELVHPTFRVMILGNNIAVYPDVSVILKRSSPPEGAKGNAVKDPAQGLSKRLCEILRVAQDDTDAEKLKNWGNIYIIT